MNVSVPGVPKTNLSLVVDPAPQGAPTAPPPEPATEPQSTVAEPVKRAYPPPTELPTQEGPKGLR
jgi:hypothetical protein